MELTILAQLDAPMIYYSAQAVMWAQFTQAHVGSTKTKSGPIVLYRLNFILRAYRTLAQVGLTRVPKDVDKFIFTDSHIDDPIEANSDKHIAVNVPTHCNHSLGLCQRGRHNSKHIVYVRGIAIQFTPQTTVAYITNSHKRWTNICRNFQVCTKHSLDFILS